MCFLLSVLFEIQDCWIAGIFYWWTEFITTKILKLDGESFAVVSIILSLWRKFWAVIVLMGDKHFSFSVSQVSYYPIDMGVFFFWVKKVNTVDPRLFQKQFYIWADKHCVSVKMSKNGSWRFDKKKSTKNVCLVRWVLYLLPQQK